MRETPQASFSQALRLPMMRSWSIPAGKMFGAEVRIHLTFAFLLFFLLLTSASDASGDSALPTVLLVGLILLSVVVHEAAHALVARYNGGRLLSITLLPIGGISTIEFGSGSRPSAAVEIRIALAGPLMNFLVAFLAGSFAVVLQPQAWFASDSQLTTGNFLKAMYWINLFLGTFNLLPAFPTDGGRVLRAILARNMDYLKATRRAVNIGHLIAIAFMLMGIRNHWLMLSGFFLLAAAQLEDRSLMFQSAVESVCMEDVMLTEFATLSPADTLEDALGKTIHSLQDDFPVVRGSDMVGVITRQKIIQELRMEGNGYVQGIMSRAFDVAQRRESLAIAFKKITARNLTIIPVVDQDRLVGIVTLQNLMHSMGVLVESRKLRRRFE